MFTAGEYEMTHIDELEQALRRAHQVSGQGSYERRAPTDEARIAFIQVRDSLREILSSEPDNVVALRLLASAEEGLLNYSAAILALERCLALTPSSGGRPLLKQLARVREYAGKWGRLVLSAEDLAALGRHLDLEISRGACDQTTRRTEAWLNSHHAARGPGILKELVAWGGYCDCEVLANVAVSWPSESRASKGRAGHRDPRQ